MDDQEITSSVLWLRNFGIDIRCIEITPYKLQDSHIILVPKFIIPLPEAEEYQVRVEKKEAIKVQSTKNQTEYASYWKLIADEFNKLNPPLTATGSNHSYMLISLGVQRKSIHYEWIIRKREGCIEIAIHFEDSSKELNLSRLNIIRKHEQAIKAGIDLPFIINETWGQKWVFAAFQLPYENNLRDPNIVKKATETMKVLIERTLPLLQLMLKD